MPERLLASGDDGGGDFVRGGALPQQQQQRQNQQNAQHADGDVRRPPALRRDRVLDERRPDRPGQVVPARHHRHRDPAPPQEPARHVGHQRPEPGRRAQPDEQVRRRENRQIGREPGDHVAGSKRQCAAQDRHRDAEPVRHPPHHHAAEREGNHRQRVRQRGVAAGHPELGLNRRQHHRHRPHADAQHGAEHDRDRQTPPGNRRIDRRRTALRVKDRPSLAGEIHGARTFIVDGRPVKTRIRNRQARRGPGAGRRCRSGSERDGKS